MPERSDLHGWIDLLVPDGPFLSAGALDVQTVGENWPTRLSVEQRGLLLAEPASMAEDGEGWDDSSWDGRRERVQQLLTELLGYREGRTLVVAPNVKAHHHIYRARVSADFVVHAPNDPDDVRMVVLCGPDATDDPARLVPSRTHSHDSWVSTPVQRAALLARHAGTNLALVTNGREHLLVNVVTGTTGSALWTVNGLEDRLARDAFVALLHKERVLHRSVSLARLIELSQDRQHELTDTLGRQVRSAAEALVNAMSRANRTSRGRLLEGLTGQQVYAATTRILMRTVFLLVAEERGLLPVAENLLFADQYAMSTLLDRLEEDAYRNRSAMERRAGAWQRMLALSRAVHAGIEHDDLRLPAYGGNLFDPEEHPFLEARIPVASGEGFEQLDIGVVDDFTVLTVLRHLQIANGQRISFRSLDVEQIGHVYEALLDHSAVIVELNQVAVLGLVGKAGDEPEIPLVELESWTAKSDMELGKQLVDMGVAAEAKGVYKVLDDGLASDSEVRQTLHVAVANDADLYERVDRYAPLLRTDARGVALVFLPGDVYVTETSSKRDSGTAYTPRSLAEEIAKHALDPLIYNPGPHNEPDEGKWKLTTPEAILDLKVCDPAVGSAAILVAAVRYLAEALLQARVEIGELAPGALASGATDAESVDVRVHARRTIVSRCIYGVDRDRMAVEMAKLSLWLVTMARDEPFSFLDHVIRAGDSLLGITSVDQLRRLHLDRESDAFGFDGGGLLSSEGAYDWRSRIEATLEWIVALRRQVQLMPVRDAADASAQQRLHREAEATVDELRVCADAMTAACLATAGQKDAETAAAIAALTPHVGALLDPLARRRLQERTHDQIASVNLGSATRMFHWPLEFPEVWDGGRRGFDTMIGNPPFMGGQKISGALGSSYRSHLVRYVSERASGSADLVVYFFRRCATLADSFGLISTNTVGQGASRDVGLKALLEAGGTVRRAVRSQRWPGAAAVHVSLVWFTRGDGLNAVLDGVPVDRIGADLSRQGESSSEPQPLAHAGLAGQGHNLVGVGFTVSPEVAARWIRDDAKNSDVLAPFFDGRAINESPTLTPARWVVDFHDWSLERARRYIEPMAHVDENVRPDRETNKNRKRREQWWLYGARAKSLERRMAGLSHLMVMTIHSKTGLPTRVANHGIFSHGLMVFPSQDWGLYAVLSSVPHRIWADKYCGSIESRLRYSPRQAFDTFPFPDVSEESASRMLQLHDERQEMMVGKGLGLTGLYGQFHESTGEAAPSFIDRLRELHRQLDQSVLGDFGWSDIDVSYEHQTVGGVKYLTATTEVRRLLEARLLKLNLNQAMA